MPEKTVNGAPGTMGGAPAGTRMRATWKGATIAESDRTVIVEGNHYFPRDSVDERVVVASDTTTTCPWKGRASYLSITVGDDVNEDAAWYYAEPSSAAHAIKDRVAFWRGVRVEPVSAA